MRVSGHKLKRARADLSPRTVAAICDRLGFPVTAGDIQYIEAQEATDLEEWHATILAAALGSALSSVQAAAPLVIEPDGPGCGGDAGPPGPGGRRGDSRL